MLLKRLVILILAVLTLCSCGTQNIIHAPEVTGEFEFAVLKAGQADAIIMQTENHCVIIDCGEKNPAEDKTAAVLENIGSSVYYTRNGDVNVTSDGERIIINGNF